MSEPNQVDAAEFRHALGSFTTGVTVVTTRSQEGTDVGLTANSFNSVSLDPPMVLWSLGKSALSLPVFRSAKYFAVHILSEDQQALSVQFAQRGVDRFAGVEIERGPEHIPLLKNCAARFICKTAYQYEGGDHIIFVGEVVDFTHWDRPPLLFHGGYYGQILSDPRVPAGAREKHLEVSDLSLTYLLRLCSNLILRPVRAELSKHGLRMINYYFLALVANYQNKTLAELLALLELGDHSLAPGDIKDLEKRGLIEQREGAVHLTVTGSKLYLELASIMKSSESEAVKHLEFDMRQTLNIALLKVVESSNLEL